MDDLAIRSTIWSMPHRVRLHFQHMRQHMRQQQWKYTILNIQRVCIPFDPLFVAAQKELALCPSTSSFIHSFQNNDSRNALFALAFISFSKQFKCSWLRTEHERLNSSQDVFHISHFLPERHSLAKDKAKNSFFQPKSNNIHRKVNAVHSTSTTIVRVLCVHLKRFNGGRSNVLYFMRNNIDLLVCKRIESWLELGHWEHCTILVFRLVWHSKYVCFKRTDGIRVLEFLQIKQWENQLTQFYCQCNALHSHCLCTFLRLSFFAFLWQNCRAVVVCMLERIHSAIWKLILINIP